MMWSFSLSINIIPKVCLFAFSFIIIYDVVVYTIVERLIRLKILAFDISEVSETFYSNVYNYLIAGT